MLSTVLYKLSKLHYIMLVAGGPTGLLPGGQTHGRSARQLPGASAVGRLTLHLRPVRLCPQHPVRATPCLNTLSSVFVTILLVL